MHLTLRISGPAQGALISKPIRLPAPLHAIVMHATGRARSFGVRDQFRQSQLQVRPLQL